MTRFRSVAMAFVALALSAGAALAFTALPDAAATGLDVATEKADRDLPARPAALPVPADADLRVAADSLVAAEDPPDAASHGVEVSDAAKPEEPPADSDHGSDVSDVARDNAGAAAVAEHKPSDAGQPDDPGPPDAVELPEDAPEDPGPPADPGQPEEPGRPN